MMYQTLGILAGIALAFYAFFLLGRLGWIDSPGNLAESTHWA